MLQNGYLSIEQLLGKNIIDSAYVKIFDDMNGHPPERPPRITSLQAFFSLNSKNIFDLVSCVSFFIHSLFTLCSLAQCMFYR